MWVQFQASYFQFSSSIWRSFPNYDDAFEPFEDEITELDYKKIVIEQGRAYDKVTYCVCYFIIRQEKKSQLMQYIQKYFIKQTRLYALANILTLKNGVRIAPYVCSILS